MVIRRAAWTAVGPLDERFALYCQDVDLCLRAAELGWEVAVIPDAVVTHHHGATISGVVEVGAGRYHAAILWADLVRLAFRHGGPREARRASRALRLGGLLQRLLLSSGLLGNAGGSDAKRERRALSAAAAALRELDPAASGTPPGSR
jgi:GT2 family glycosyltransferase